MNSPDEHTVVLALGTTQNLFGERVTCAYGLRRIGRFYHLASEELEGPNAGERKTLHGSDVPDLAQGAVWRFAGVRVSLSELVS